VNLGCSSLETFNPANLDDARRAFRTAVSCAMGQAWRREPDAGFSPAEVRTGWRDGSLWILAALTDRDIFTRATALNQRCWDLGDAFEIFLRPEFGERYVELQVTPNHHRLQLQYTHRAALDRARASGDLSGALIPGEAFRSTVWVEPGRWIVLAEVPSVLVCPEPKALAGQRWRFSFSRYDYTRGQLEPVISSTSPHPQADFHRQEDWGFLIFKAR
jgi:hypothetical protein